MINFRNKQFLVNLYSSTFHSVDQLNNKIQQNLCPTQKMIWQYWFCYSELTYKSLKHQQYCFFHISNYFKLSKMLSQFSISSILVSRKSYTETRKLILLLRVNYENNVVQKNLPVQIKVSLICVYSYKYKCSFINITITCFDVNMHLWQLICVNWFLPS